MARRASAKSNRWLKILGWTAGTVVVLVIAALLLGQAWLNRYLASTEFRQMIESKTGRNLRAQVGITPIQFKGMEFFCENFDARGARDAAFSRAKVDELRGEVSLPSVIAFVFGDRRTRVPKLEIQRLTLEFFDRDRLDLNLPEKEKRENRSVIENLHIRDVRLEWGGGGLTGAEVHAMPVDGGWQINGQGGRIKQLGLPAIDLVSARISKKESDVFIQEARLRQGSGELAMSGQIASKDKADLLLEVSNVAVTPLLPEDWRARLHGNLFGELRVRVPLNDTEPVQPSVTGPVRLEGAVIEALPILNRIADYLRTDQFRRVSLNQVSGTLHYDQQGFRMDDVVLESKQLIALRGRFTFRNGHVDGTFELGITPGPLQWLPGSQEKVFTTNRDGYVWAPMRVTGPPNALKEDLSGRLLAAAGNAIVEKVENTATQAVDTAVDSANKGAKGVLDFLFGK